MSSFISNTGRKLEEAHGDDPRPASRLLLRLLQQEFCPKLHTQGAHRGKAHPQLLPHLVPILAKTLFITYCCPIEQKLGCTYLKFVLSLTISNFWWMGKHILALTWENLYKTVPAAPLNKKLDCSYLMFLSLEIYNFWSMTKRSLEKIFTKRFQQRMSGFCLFNEISTLPVRSVSSLSRTKRTRADTSGRCTRATSLGRISRETSSRSTSFLQESMSSLNIRINWF